MSVRRIRITQIEKKVVDLVIDNKDDIDLFTYNKKQEMFKAVEERKGEVLPKTYEITVQFYYGYEHNEEEAVDLVITEEGVFIP